MIWILAILLISLVIARKYVPGLSKLFTVLIWIVSIILAVLVVLLVVLIGAMGYVILDHIPL